MPPNTRETLSSELCSIVETEKLMPQHRRLRWITGATELESNRFHKHHRGESSMMATEEDEEEDKSKRARRRQWASEGPSIVQLLHRALTDTAGDEAQLVAVDAPVHGGAEGTASGT
jgi:hypothetical protein